MNDADQFEKLVRDKLAAVEAQRRERKAKFVAEMTARAYAVPHGPVKRPPRRPVAPDPATGH
ncbi:MAG TPA: hypothetical protein VND64_28880 [Pirellulales bacterium]|nr:hypothetical protein [Pirellulales bacterium]